MRKFKKVSVFLLLFVLSTSWALAGNPDLKLVIVKDHQNGIINKESNLKEFNFTIFGLKNPLEANALADKFWYEDKHLKGLMQTFNMKESQLDGSYSVHAQFLPVLTKKYFLELLSLCGFEKITIDDKEVVTREMIKKS